MILLRMLRIRLSDSELFNINLSAKHQPRLQSSKIYKSFPKPEPAAGSMPVLLPSGKKSI